MWSWLTGNGVFKEDDFDDDRDQLADFYHSRGYLDFEIKDVKLDHPTTNTMVIRFYLYEGRQYKVGSVTFTGNKLFNAEEIHRGLQGVHNFRAFQGQARPARPADGYRRHLHARWPEQGHAGHRGFLRQQGLY